MDTKAARQLQLSRAAASAIGAAYTDLERRGYEHDEILTALHDQLIDWSDHYGH